MLIVASIQWDWLALKTVSPLILFTVIAGQLYYLLFLTFGTVIVIILSSTDIHQHVIFIAFQEHRPFLISSDLHTIVEASFTETSEATSVIVVLITLF